MKIEDLVEEDMEKETRLSFEFPLGLISQDKVFFLTTADDGQFIF